MAANQLPDNLHRDTLAVRAAVDRSQYGENSEALYLTSGYVQPSAEASARRFAGDEDGYANSNIANIPGSLQSCASPGFFYTANSPADITAALNAMFNHALVTAHITN